MPNGNVEHRKDQRIVKPEFIDNRDGNTLAAALCGHLDWLAEAYRQPVELAIATGYFNPEAFAMIAERLERLPRVRLRAGNRERML